VCDEPVKVANPALDVETPLNVVVANKTAVSARNFIVTLLSIAFATGIRPRHHNI
jgi:hypothetical protein